MAITETDVQMFAARIRAYFPPELRESAFSLALAIAHVVGPKAKSLRPETTLDEIIEWLRPHYVGDRDSPDEVELVMAIEEELGVSLVLSEEFAGSTDTATFGELVQQVAASERAA
jgi:hypothetical protein